MLANPHKYVSLNNFLHSVCIQCGNCHLSFECGARGIWRIIDTPWHFPPNGMRPFIPQNSKRDANPLGGNSATQEILLGIRNHHGSKHFGEFLPISWQFLVKNHSASRTFDLCWVSKALFCWIFPFFGAKKGHFLKNWGMKIGGFWQPIGWEELLQHLSCISSTKPKAKHFPNNSLF